MKYRSHNAKRDAAEPAIVSALEAAGWHVYRELPVDLLCIKRVGDRAIVRLLEVKTPRGKKNPKAVIDKRQKEQIEFIEATGTPRVTTPFEALLAVGERVEL